MHFLHRNIVLFLMSLLALSSVAQQKITYAEHIRPILQQHCISCHRPNDIGPFSLLTYEDAAPRAGFIEHVTSTKYMPPWRADSSFSHFKNENLLSENEIALIKRWVEDGREKGKIKKNEKTVQSENPSAITSTANEVELKRFSMKNAYVIPGNSKEQFRYFHISFDNKEPLYVTSIRFIPGNKKLVHHSRVMTDTTLSLSGIDGMSADDTATYAFQSKPLSDPFLFGWVPGNNRIQFPAQTAKTFYPHTDLLLNIHYAPSPVQEKDSSMVEIGFLKTPQQREIKTITITEEAISNPPFFIKAERTAKFYMKYDPLEEDISLISIMPHMHLLGKSFRAFAITPDGELVKLIHIPAWDFNWQMSYTYPRYVKLPKGTIIYAEGEYDNTSKNPRNPYQPAKDIGLGWGTKDEMMNLVLYFVKYQEGDENVIL
ncbi:MAG: hypothetical protein EBU80_09355 [Chitinophagia bacterium]|nr:hypothetical protein [Chitinophagia bacterium]